MSHTGKIRVRFPPSPTGYCHVGTARMALINYLFAKKHSGEIVFRSEDTDRERSRAEYESDIQESLEWLGLSWDEFYRQSERLPRHEQAIQRLIETGKAYVSVEESKRDPGTTVEIVRLRNPGSTITFRDIVRGDITVDTTDLGDFAIARSIRDPLYHLAVVVDDAEMNITHVIRGEEHISNTPRQILIQEALGYKRPVYAHYPLFLSTERAKLSKRKGDVAVKEYRTQGYLPEALVNFIGTLGWTPPSGRELLTLKEMIDEFELTALHTSGAVFNLDKLRWYNRQYLERMSVEAFAAYAQNALSAALAARSVTATPQQLRPILVLLRDRISVSSDIRDLVGAGEFDCFVLRPALDRGLIAEKRSTPSAAREHLDWMKKAFADIPPANWSSDVVKAAVWDYATSEGRGSVLWPLRYALSGRDKSPDPFTIAGIIGKDETIRRVTIAREALTL